MIADECSFRLSKQTCKKHFNHETTFNRSHHIRLKGYAKHNAVVSGGSGFPAK